eukprot:6376915-Prymnesium_polylepis.1
MLRPSHRAARHTAPPITPCRPSHRAAHHTAPPVTPLRPCCAAGHTAPPATPHYQPGAPPEGAPVRGASS